MAHIVPSFLRISNVDFAAMNGLAKKRITYLKKGMGFKFGKELTLYSPLMARKKVLKPSPSVKQWCVFMMIAPLPSL